VVRGKRKKGKKSDANRLNIGSQHKEESPKKTASIEKDIRGGWGTATDLGEAGKKLVSQKTHTGEPCVWVTQEFGGVGRLRGGRKRKSHLWQVLWPAWKRDAVERSHHDLSQALKGH